MCHTFSLPFSQFYGSFFISHGFPDFEGIFSKTQGFLRKQRQHNSLSENIVQWSSRYKKKKDRNPSFRDCFLELTWKWLSLEITKNFMENNHQASILLKLVFSQIVVVISSKFFKIFL